MIIKANMLQSVGCEVAAMMFVDGQVITVIGTPKGKDFLQTHPAIVSSFGAYFKYGTSLYCMHYFLYGGCCC